MRASALESAPSGVLAVASSLWSRTGPWLTPLRRAVARCRAIAGFCGPVARTVATDVRSSGSSAFARPRWCLGSAPSTGRPDRRRRECRSRTRASVSTSRTPGRPQSSRAGGRGRVCRTPELPLEAPSDSQMARAPGFGLGPCDDGWTPWFFPRSHFWVVRLRPTSPGLMPTWSSWAFRTPSRTPWTSANSGDWRRLPEQCGRRASSSLRI
jgi:hypothetical protein